MLNFDLEEAVQYNTKRVAQPTPGFAMLVYQWQETRNLESDGKYGPVTEASVEADLVPEPSTTVWETFDGPQDKQPKNLREVYQQLGNPGNVSVNVEWFKKNVVECHRDNGNRLPGIPAWLYIKVHRIVEPYLREALRRVQISCPDYKIHRLGSFNFRPIRGNPKNGLSKHSWAIAFDVNSRDNYVKTYAKGKAPQAWTSEWDAVWPKGVPKAFVDAFASCGFAWGSDWDEDGSTTDHTFQDPMHFEWVARDGNSIEV